MTSASLLCEDKAFLYPRASVYNRQHLLQSIQHSGMPLQCIGGSGLSAKAAAFCFEEWALHTSYIEEYQNKFVMLLLFTPWKSPLSAVFENDMKWYATDPSGPTFDYSTPDAMLAWCDANGIPVRGHNIFWDIPEVQQVSSRFRPL